jgi:hypothetical protein
MAKREGWWGNEVARDNHEIFGYTARKLTKKRTCADIPLLGVVVCLKIDPQGR